MHLIIVKLFYNRYCYNNINKIIDYVNQGYVTY